MIGKEIIGRYQIESQLGAGGMGTVFRGTDTHTGETVAIKQLKPEMAQPDIIERFQREGEALRELNHPNMVKLLDTVVEGGNYYLILEYISGGDLKGVLEKGQLPIEQVLNIAIQIADALTRAHFLNIIHRDLKPANILLAEDGTPLLTDFGVAHMANKDPVTDTNAIIGTIDYLAPEVFGGNNIDNRIDIWAFGVMLFEMLTGYIPFDGKTIVLKIMAITSEATPDLEEMRPDAPIALIDLIYRMLEKDPQARIASIRHVGAALEDILQGRTTHTPPESRFATPIPSSFEHPKHNLPAQTTEFVGREAELTELAKLLDDSKIRLISIVAAGGMGKTRLGLEVAEQQISNFEHGVFFVPLQSLGSFDDQLISVLQRFIKMLREGYSVLQCFEYVAEHAPEPTASASRELIASVKSGTDFFVALHAMLDHVESNYFGSVVATMQKQFKEGGNLADRLDELETELKSELGELRWSNKQDYAEGLIIPAIANATSYQFQSDGREQKQQILDFLSNKTMLLVMDNFEHLLDGASLMTDILNAAPNVKILATSRQRLNQSGETVFNLEGMDFPEWETPQDALDYAAVKLFMQSAKRVQPQFELTLDNMGYIARICILVQGMPLGILLAASWLSMLSVEEIAEEISKGIDFLESDMGDLPERHRSIRAVFDYSWNLMNEDERDVFMKLSVFRGGFTREAAQEITGANLRILMNLMNKSLIRRDAESGRYQIHELLRQYGESQLNTSDKYTEIRKQHSILYIQHLADLGADLRGKRLISALDAVEADIDNIRIAWDWDTTHRNSDKLEAAGSFLQLFYSTRDLHAEGEQVFSAVTQRLKQQDTSQDKRLLAQFLIYNGRFARLQFKNDLAEMLFEESHQIFESLDDEYGLAEVLEQQGYLARFSYENINEQVINLFTESLEIRRRIGDKSGVAYTLWRLGEHLGQNRLAQQDTALVYLEESVQLFREIDDFRGLPEALRILGRILAEKGEIERAKDLLNESLEIFKLFKSDALLAAMFGTLGNAAVQNADFHEAVQWFDKGITLLRNLGDNRRLEQLLISAAWICWRGGEFQSAKAYAEAVLETLSINAHPRTVLNAHVNLAHILTDLGEIDAAKKQYLMSFNHIPTNASQEAHAEMLSEILLGLAKIKYHSGYEIEAIEELSLVIAHPYTHPTICEISRDVYDAFTQNCDSEVSLAASERGKSLDLETVVQELITEFGEKE